jgi:hypothetical protein
MGHPSSIVTIASFAFLVRAHFCERFFVRARIVLHRNLRCHSAHRESFPAMASLDTEQRIRMHEMRRHRNDRAIGQ